MSEIICPVCMHACRLQEGQLGRCRARKNEAGRNVCISYGRIASMAMDPIEKKPLVHFYPGSHILSVGSYGCNLSCPFCQNHSISMSDGTGLSYRIFTAQDLAEMAMNQPDNLGIAFTYNEPLIGWEYILDTAKLIRPSGLKTVIVTNGTANLPVLEHLMPYTDAMNIDLKGDESFYRELGGDCQTVRNTISYVYDKCHLEVTMLIIPGKNDSVQYVSREAQWLGSLNPDIVLHLTRYFPRYHYSLPPTDISLLYELQKEAQKYLNTVAVGNV
ncbi:MAG: radical SAM protein [Erysipelotrichia bacterium]|nr:radical SAM protein [Erysipelotrichia bacterium]